MSLGNGELVKFFVYESYYIDSAKLQSYFVSFSLSRLQSGKSMSLENEHKYKQKRVIWEIDEELQKISNKLNEIANRMIKIFNA